MNTKSPKIFALSIAASLILISCQSAKGIYNEKHHSKLSQVNMKLPASTAFKPTSGNAVVDTYRLVISPKDSTCVKATSLDETKSYADTTLSPKLAKGCDYLVTVALGEKVASGSLASYYENSVKKEVRASELEASPVEISVMLSLTDAGRTAYMPESLSNNAVPNPVPAPTPTNTPLPPLAASMQGDILDSNGNEVSLESVFTTEFLVIDFSGAGCDYCVKHARQVNSDSDAQKIFSGNGKCKSITGVSKSDLNAWLSTVGKSSFVGKHSYGHSNGLNAFSRMFGLSSVSGTPTFLFVNRKGDILNQSVGVNPSFDSQVKQQCR